jgi:hypothetical protein
MVSIMVGQQLRVVILLTLIFFTITLTPYAWTSLQDQRMYEYAFSNLAVQVGTTSEAYPGQNITVNIFANASAKLTINYTAIELYTFSNLTMADENFSLIVWIDHNSSISLSPDQTPIEASYDVKIPDDAFNVVYGKLVLIWTETGTEESTTYARNSTLVATSLKNAELENLRSRVPELEKENADLKNNNTETNNNLTKALNDLADTKNNLTKALNDLADTKNQVNGATSVIAVLAITTIFFVATTLYLVLRRPKQYW